MLFQPPSWCRGWSWEREEMPIEAPRPPVPCLCRGTGPSWGKGGIGIACGTGSPMGQVTYQISLLAGVPRWSLGAFPALEGRKMRAEQ